MTPEMEIRAKTLEIAAILLIGSGCAPTEERLFLEEHFYAMDYVALAARIQDMIAGG
jgi:hypothetical protein